MRKIGEPRKLEIYNDLYWAVRIGTVKQTLEDLRDSAGESVKFETLDPIRTHVLLRIANIDNDKIW